MTYSYTQSETFTLVHARKLSSKVAADMHLCAMYYGKPSEESIRNYAEELAHYLNNGYVSEYEFGYQKNNQRVVSWRYKVDENGLLTVDDRPGKVVPYVDISDASFFNFMTWSWKYSQMSEAERSRFKEALPVKRGTGSPPTDGAGYWTTDRNYYTGGRGLNRQTFQPA